MNIKNEALPVQKVSPSVHKDWIGRRDASDHNTIATSHNHFNEWAWKPSAFVFLAGIVSESSLPQAFYPSTPPLPDVKSLLYMQRVSQILVDQLAIIAVVDSGATNLAHSDSE